MGINCMPELFESRQHFKANLISLLKSDTQLTDEALSVAIDAGWGYGKSFFLEKLAESLLGDNQMVVRFNAWESDISGDAFISVADTLFTELKKYLIDTSVFFEKADLAVRAFGAAMLNIGTSKIPGKRITQSVRKAYNELIEKEASLFSRGVDKTWLGLVKDRVEESLDEFFSKCKEEYYGKKVFVLVDELDRCRPDYAVQVLERIKHLFKDRRLSFVFAINKKELEESIKKEYGEIDTSVYFEKFFTFSFKLPEIDINSFLATNTCFDGNESQRASFLLLSRMIKDAGQRISLRQIERVLGYFEAVCRIVQDFSQYTSAPYLIPVAVFSKVVDSVFFHDVFEKRRVSHFYPVGDKKSDFKVPVYDRFLYVDGRGQGYANVFGRMTSVIDQEENVPGIYKSDDEKLPLGKGNLVTILRFDHRDLLKIYRLVDCLL